ncbi:MAG: ribosomal subunit interface protein, partial [Candidatus Magasanikbacteria bacterium CG_4_10_14_0_8_um_filter_32_14]
MKINIKATNIDLTEAIREYTMEKVQAMEHYFDNIQNADVEIGLDSQNKAKP